MGAKSTKQARGQRQDPVGDDDEAGYEARQKNCSANCQQAVDDAAVTGREAVTLADVLRPALAVAQGRPSAGVAPVIPAVLQQSAAAATAAVAQPDSEPPEPDDPSAPTMGSMLADYDFWQEHVARHLPARDALRFAASCRDARCTLPLRRAPAAPLAEPAREFEDPRVVAFRGVPRNWASVGEHPEGGQVNPWGSCCSADPSSSDDDSYDESAQQYEAVRWQHLPQLDLRAHTATLRCKWKDQGWGNFKGGIFIVRGHGHAPGDPGKARVYRHDVTRHYGGPGSTDNDGQRADPEWVSLSRAEATAKYLETRPERWSEDVVAGVEPAPHGMESVELSWQPKPGERYSVWVRIGGGGCHGLTVEEAELLVVE